MANSNKDFKKLQAKWYAKLKKSGFEDAEKNEYELYSPSSNFTRAETGGVSGSSRALVSQAAKRDYYLMATSFLNSHQFKNNLERIIWEYHSNGLSCRDIAKTLNKIRKKKIHYVTLWWIVHELELIMKKEFGVIK